MNDKSERTANPECDELAQCITEVVLDVSTEEGRQQLTDVLVPPGVMAGLDDRGTA